ncbi:MAG: DUF2058 domain-containing protein [Desulfobulbaceae bacterium]|nr:DUF2058 domain-containing protein [Desulfobulbaceae bacterium]HIJ78916.1 DUF2058 domain-containing protein [Deltaproteobacteria bacterium]
MGNPLKDQLLKAGLVSKKQAKKVEHEKRISRQQNQGKVQAPQSNQVREEQAAHARRNQELTRQRAEEARRKEQKAQVKQLIESNRLALDGRGEAYFFADQNKVKRLFVAEEMAEQLSRGQLAIVRLGNGYEVVPAKVAHQIANRDPEAVVAFHQGG